ncbi:hypothetical protein EV421DRAFT_1898048 [Armillaria borealis]|uniref:Uncharacterized protein n=1 Tax=Armillaria borealis TaxID=47425 RepID=A0AA39MZE5_9AGAR|nr:hypothetical protein EV421DRAFT_1898048 [Armillaria borealis]
MFSNSNKTPSPEDLPDQYSLSPPSDLFTSTAPYILTVSLIDKPGFSPSLVVDCSHEPSLNILKRYLENWTNTSLTYVESDFIPGKMDSLVVKASGSLLQRGGKVNATVILAFIEVQNGFWHYGFILDVSSHYFVHIKLPELLVQTLTY